MTGLNKNNNKPRKIIRRRSSGDPKDRPLPHVLLLLSINDNYN